MRGNEIGNEIESETPPNCAEYIAGDFLHLLHDINNVVNFWKELEQEHEQKY